jgi:hypothetical protein
MRAACTTCTSAVITLTSAVLGRTAMIKLAEQLQGQQEEHHGYLKLADISK